MTGGTGALGRQVARGLATSGARVRIASRHSRPAERDLDLQWSTVDYRSRAGLDGALADVDVVVHCIGGMGRAEAETMAALLSSGRRAGLAHLVYISIVGVDTLPLGYYRAKYSAERALIGSGIPWTILRATQFHELALTLVRGMCRLPVAVAPRLSCQPVASAEVAARLVELAAAPPAGRVPEFGGPEIRSYAELAQTYLRWKRGGQRRPRRVAAVPVPGKLARGLRAGDGMTPDHGDGVQTFAEFLALRAPER